MLNITSWTVNLVQKCHLILYNLNSFVDVLSVANYDLLLLFKNQFDYFFMFLVQTVCISTKLNKQVILARHIRTNDFELRCRVLLKLLFSSRLLNWLWLYLVDREQDLFRTWCCRLLLFNLSDLNWILRRKHIWLNLSLRWCCHRTLLLNWLRVWLRECFWKSAAYTFRHVHKHLVVDFGWLHLVNAIINRGCNWWSRSWSFNTCCWNIPSLRWHLWRRSLPLRLWPALHIRCCRSSLIINVKLFNLNIRHVVIISPSSSLLSVKLLNPTIVIIFIFIVILIIIKILALVKVLQF